MEEAKQNIVSLISRRLATAVSAPDMGQITQAIAAAAQYGITEGVEIVGCHHQLY